MKTEPALNATFVTSSAELNQCPDPNIPEYAFIGRSNVGKSSLINMLTGLKMLAKISSTPGKTRLINHFLINDEWYLVDLPGYGYARVGRRMRNLWEKLIADYLFKRTNLMTTFILLDARLPLQENDKLVINWFGKNQLPFVLVMTKADKLSVNDLGKNKQLLKEKLLEDWEELPPIIISSAVKRSGRDEILDYIVKTNACFLRGTV
jgi:GTP-binding protein